MALSPSSRLGRYEILSPLGAGGMGEVYRARDTRLKRDVAIKVLPASYSQEADRLRRFEQEAQAAGGLNSQGASLGTVPQRPAAVPPLVRHRPTWANPHGHR